MEPQEVVIEQGQVLCYRIFDIAQEIDLFRAQEALSRAVRRMKLTRAGSEYLQLPDPPLTVELGRRMLPLGDGPVEVEALARVFAHGAASIILRVPIPGGTSLNGLIPLADELFDSPAVDALARELVTQLRRDLAPAETRGHLWDQSESYTIIYSSRLRGDPPASQVLATADLGRLLLGEREAHPLSAQEQAEVVKASFSYTERDLAVIDWNGAFVYEPSGSQDVPDVLEICNAQLLELRYYDDVLDRNIKAVYDGLETPPPGWKRLFRSPYRRLARRVMLTLLEMSEFIERVENSLKIIGDFYLARVYEGAVKRLRIRQWQASVTRKQDMLGKVYALLKGEVDTDRGLTLEAAIVLLIVVDIVLALL
jgi:hypothetical protein